MIDEVRVQPVEVAARRYWSVEHDSILAVVRRALDVAVSLAILVLALPALLLIGLLIRLDSPGPALFRQTRLGHGGAPFQLLKFRGMYVDAEERWPELYDYTFDEEAVADLRFHPMHDPRVTRIGRFIRRTSIDEIPNFWNVFKGEMTLVGPRPEIPEMIRYYGRHAARILAVKPGITSLAKVTGRDGHTFSETLRLDLEYLEGRSLALDFKILAWTVVTVLVQRGVRAG